MSVIGMSCSTDIRLILKICECISTLCGNITYTHSHAVVCEFCACLGQLWERKKLASL